MASNLLASVSTGEAATDRIFDEDPDHFGRAVNSGCDSGQQQPGFQHEGQLANIGEVYNDRSNPNGDSVCSSLSGLVDDSFSEVVGGHEILWIGG